MSLESKTCPKNNNIKRDYDLQDIEGIHCAPHHSNAEQNGFDDINGNALGSEHNALHKDNGKRKINAIDRSSDICYFNALSVEIVAYVFSRLDPISLATVANVCRHWRYIVTDDRCWRNAFEAHFGTLPFKRLRTESWKSEYILRTHLVRKWEKGRGSVVSFNPKVGLIDTMSVDFEKSSMIVGSAEQGSAVRCNIATGKVDRHPILTSQVDFNHRPTVLKTDGHRLAWGFPGGILSMTTTKSGIVHRQIRRFESIHRGDIKALALPIWNQDVILTAGVDLVVKLHDIKSASCVLNLTGLTSQPTCLELIGNQYVVAGTVSGSLEVWQLSVKDAVKLYREHLWQQMQPEAISRQPIPVTKATIAAPPLEGMDFSVRWIEHDGKSPVILVGYEQSNKVYRYDLVEKTCTAVFAHSLGSVTCMKWDTVLEEVSSSLIAALKPRTREASQGKRNISKDIPPTPAAPVSMMRLLVTGDTEGTVYVWDGDAQCPEGGTVQPLRVLYGHKYPISALFVDGCKIVSGSDDGWIRVWDPLTGMPLTVFANKVPRRVGMDRYESDIMKVTNIWCNNYQGVATIGGHIKSWDFSPDKELLVRRILRTRTRANAKESRQLYYEITQELKESKASMTEEKQRREKEAKMLDKMTLGGLSDEEMLAYALLLSKEDTGMGNFSEASDPAAALEPSSSNAFSADDYVDDTDEDLINALMASLATENTAMSTSGGDDSSDDTPSTCSLYQEPNVDEWPSVTPAFATQQQRQSTWNDTKARIIEPLTAHRLQSNTSQTGYNDEEDEELQYALLLSREQV